MNIFSALLLGLSLSLVSRAEPHKLCKTSNGACSYACGFEDGSTCKLVRGQCNANVGVEVYQGYKPGFVVAILTARPDESPYMAIFCKSIGTPKYHGQTADQQIEQLFGK